MTQARASVRPLQALALTLLLTGLLPLLPGPSRVARAVDKPKAERKAATPTSPLDATGWLPENEWLLSGNYAEASDEPGISLAFLGAPPCSGVSRKALVFQLGSPSHYRAIDLTGMIVVVMAEGPPNEPLTVTSRPRWRRADLLLSDRADSLQAEALIRVMKLTLSGPGGPDFTRVSRVPLGVGMSKERAAASSADLLDLVVRPLTGGNPDHPPQLQNQAGPFPFFGYVSLARVDTLFYAPPGGGETWSCSGTAGATSPFGWSSERVAAAGH